MSIRPANPGDLEQCVAIAGEGFEPDDCPGADEFLAWCATPGSTLLVDDAVEDILERTRREDLEAMATVGRRWVWVAVLAAMVGLVVGVAIGCILWR